LPHRPALVATSHGTANADGTAAVGRLVDAVRSTRDADGGTVVEAFVDVHGPYVDEVVAGLDGNAVVVPLLLAAGFHVKVDIARATAPWSEASASCALGPDDRLTAVLVDRLREAGVGPDDAVVLAAAGSSDDEADAAVRVQARLLETAWGAPVHVAYGASRRPRIADEVARLRAEGADRVAVASYLIATGHFHRTVLGAGADVVTDPLLTEADPDPRLVDLVVARYECAAGGCRLGPCTARTPAAEAVEPAVERGQQD
jgi:sirohydrochlorin ferrochelatase